jgi:hypothetical protein
MPVITSIRNESLQLKRAAPLPLCQFWLARAVLAKAKERHWDGKRDTKLPIQPSDIDLAALERCGDLEKSRSAGLAIPPEAEGLYLGPEAERLIRSLVWRSRDEFLMYAAAAGVNRHYLDDINRSGFPKEEARLKYNSTKAQNAGSSYSVGFGARGSRVVEDYSQRMMMLNAHALYVMAYDMEKSGILDPRKIANTSDYWREYRDMAVRYTTYHEMVHIVQKEINALNVRDAADKTKKAAWVMAERNILMIDNTHFRKWGDGFAQYYNLTVAGESQAEGVAAKMVMEAYGMSDIQRKLFWEFRFGRLEEGRKNLKETLDLLEANWPDFNPEYLGVKIGDDIFATLPGTEQDNKIKRYGIRIARWLETIAYHQGVLNPMTPDDSARFWSYLKPTPLLFSEGRQSE